MKAGSATYQTASSKVIIAGGVGDSFQLWRSVRQGCPLAPYLFLFYAEALSVYMSATTLDIQGMHITNGSEDLLDSEFADDTAMYVHGTVANLKRVQAMLERFCLGSGARLNWSKTMAFWVSENPLPTWSLHLGFRWIPKRVAVRYLECQVGINILPELQISPVLHSIIRS